MNSDFYLTLKRVRFRSANFPDAISKLESEYDELLLILREYQLEKPEILMKFCIHAYNQITHEQAKIAEWNTSLQRKDLEKLTKGELDKHQIELDYYRDILTIADSARAELLEHVAAYAPEKINTPDLQKELKSLNPFSTVALTFKPSLQNETKTERLNETKTNKLKVPQIALIHVYEGIQITRRNAEEIAAKYGYTAINSGEGLFQDYTNYSSTANRKGKPTPCTPKKLKNKIELFESVVSHLSDNNKQWAIDEINTLKTLLENEYQ